MIEQELWNSSFAGAYLLWRFALGYQAAAHTSPHLLLSFPALQILSSAEMLAAIPSKRTMPALETYLLGFVASSRRRVLAQLPMAIERRKDWTRQVITAAIVCRLVALDCERGTLVPAPKTIETPQMRSHISELRKSTGIKAEKLGACFARLPAHEVFEILGVKP